MKKMDEKELVILSIGSAHELSQKASDARDYARIRRIWQMVKDDPELVGDANDYHNYSVVLSRLDDYLTAYHIVERGLQQFPYNTDLLADAIYYGSNCKKYIEARNYVDILTKRPYSSWTWRAFQFTIDFLRGSWDWEDNPSDVENSLNIALTLAEKYRKYYPSDERSYLSGYKIRMDLAKAAMDSDQYEKSKKYEEDALEGLRKTIDKGEYAAVQCCLRYADEMFRKQKFDEVIRVCDRALQFGQESATARLGYFMYLSAQSREAILYKKKEWRKDTQEVETIYREYLAALSDTGSDYIRNIKRRVDILSARSGVPVIDSLQKKLDATPDNVNINQLLEMLREAAGQED